MPLEEYKKKRNFSKTSEPKAEEKETREEGRIYVIQKHDASHLHYDLRLEMDGILKSWAIPKKPPERPGPKRLAIQTEDHPIQYADFEGTIPEGQYGAGTVSTWDKGTFEILSRKENKLVFTINGQKLKGDYVLLRMKPREQKKNWLLFKKK